MKPTAAPGAEPTATRPPVDQPTLVATLGRWDLTTLVINTVVGGGIFGLPLIVAEYLGRESLLGYLAAAAGIAVIVLCFAEVSTQVRAAGGPYLYAREAFGPFVGLQIGWVTWVMRIAATGANANLFVAYLATLWPAAETPGIRVAIITVAFLVPVIVNIRGIRQGATASTLFVAAKFVPLLIFVAAGLALRAPGTAAAWPEPSSGHWFRAVLLLVFAFGGFDNAVVPASEMRDPARDAPVSLFAGMAVVTALYLLIQVAFQSAVAPGTVSDEPLATAAGHVLGSGGAMLMAVGAVVSIWGWFAAVTLGTPRLTFALGEHGDFPRVFAAVHPRFRTPYVSILCFAALGWILALTGSFEWNAGLSAVARLLTYGATCAALPIFRRREPRAQAFRVPAGDLIATLGVAFCVVLLLQMGRTEFLILAVTILVAALTWAWSRRTARGLPS